jgi:hypothetical protein
LTPQFVAAAAAIFDHHLRDGVAFVDSHGATHRRAQCDIHCGLYLGCRNARLGASHQFDPCHVGAGKVGVFAETTPQERQHGHGHENLGRSLDTVRAGESWGIDTDNRHQRAINADDFTDDI